MPAIVVPSEHGASAIELPSNVFANGSYDALAATYPKVKPDFREMLQSSFDEDHPVMRPSTNGLVYTVLEAYNRHHHLHLRPDDIWIAILTQFSTYVNAHAEELRGQFVAHAGQKELEIIYDRGTRKTVDFGTFAQQITRLLEQEVVDPDLRAWMMPGFTTSTQQDAVVASIVMMGSLQAYFTYQMTTRCGIPSVTLHGEREDYELILHKLEKLATFGEEPAQFARLLTPVVSRMVRAFDDAAHAEVIDFWQRIVDTRSQGSGRPICYTGWISAFCFWDKDGKCLYQKSGAGHRFSNGPLVLDGVQYHAVDKTDVPPGWTKVPLRIDDNGEKLNAEMVAGSVGITCFRRGKVMDSVKPELGWWVYEVQKPVDW